MRRLRMIVLPIALFLTWSLSSTAFGIPPSQWRDIDKWNLGDSLYYNDDIVTDQMHTPTEDVKATNPGTYRAGPDWSCWMATACNILWHEGEAALHGGTWKATYGRWLMMDGPEDNQPYPWDPTQLEHPNSVNRFTFDDAGYINWALRRGGFDDDEIDMILTNEHIDQWPAGTDPVTWCTDKINNCHPVGIHIWAVSKRAEKGPRNSDLCHCITLWRVDRIGTSNKYTIYVTDSDSDDDGNSQHYETTWDPIGRTWRFTYYDTPATICYCVAKHGAGATRAEPTTWGRVKSLYRE